MAMEHVLRALAPGMDTLTFAWAGGTSPGERHYYRVQGPTLLTAPTA